MALDGIRSVGACLVLLVLSITSVNPVVRPIIATVAATFVALIGSRVTVKETRPRRRLIDLYYLRYGLWVSGWMTVISLIPWVERLIIAHRLDVGVAGTYAALCDPILSVMSALTAILVSVLFPRMIAAWQARDVGEIENLIRIGQIGAMGIGFVVLTFGVIIASTNIGKLSQLISGHAITAMVVLVGGAVWQSAIFAHKPFELANRTGQMFALLAIAGGVGLGVSNLLVARYGILGVAVGKVIGALSYIILVRLKRRSVTEW